MTKIPWWWDQVRNEMQRQAFSVKPTLLSSDCTRLGFLCTENYVLWNFIQKWSPVWNTNWMKCKKYLVTNTLCFASGFFPFTAHTPVLRKHLKKMFLDGKTHCNWLKIYDLWVGWDKSCFSDTTAQTLLVGHFCSWLRVRQWWKKGWDLGLAHPIKEWQICRSSY